MTLIQNAQAYYLVFDPKIEELTSVDILRFDFVNFFGYLYTRES